MNNILVGRLLAVSLLLLPLLCIAAEPEQPVTGAAIIQKFQDGFDSQKTYLQKPLDDLAGTYRESLTRKKEEYTKANDPTGALAATNALASLASDSAETPSPDQAVEALRAAYVDQRDQKLKEIAPKVRAMLVDYAEKLKGLITSLMQSDNTDDALAMAERAQQIRNWLTAQPADEVFTPDLTKCLLTKGAPILNSVWAWGRNDFGQTNVPPKLIGVIAVAAGIQHSLALKYDGTVVAWGSNEFGQATVPEGLRQVAAIAAGEKHSLALKADGTVVVWGYNREKQCQVPADLPKVKAIAAHTWYSLALTVDGKVVAWGRDAGHGALTIPADLADVIQISAGAGHNLALKRDGTVVAWGLNDQGQTNVPADLPKIVSIATGHFHSLALTADGKIIGWGFNNYGQLNPPRDVARVSAITAQGWHSAALTSDGRVAVWGFKNQGQIDVPKELTYSTGISSGTYHLLALGPVKP
jgi:hypothetical protein